MPRKNFKLIGLKIKFLGKNYFFDFFQTFFWSCLGKKKFWEKKLIGPPKFFSIQNFVRLTIKNRKKNFWTVFFSKIFRFCWFSLTMALKHGQINKKRNYIRWYSKKNFKKRSFIKIVIKNQFFFLYQLFLTVLSKNNINRTFTNAYESWSLLTLIYNNMAP